MNQIRSKTLLAVTATAICACHLHCAPAFAQQRELKSGLNYTTMGRKAKPAETKEASPATASGTPRAERGRTSLPAKLASANKTDNGEETDEATRIWNKYKELATGTADKDKEKDKDAKDTKSVETPDKPTVDKPALKDTSKTAPPPQKNAFGEILQEWKSQKENRRDMRSLSFNSKKAEKNSEPKAEEKAEKDSEAEQAE